MLVLFEDLGKEERGRGLGCKPIARTRSMLLNAASPLSSRLPVPTLSPPSSPFSDSGGS